MRPSRSISVVILLILPPAAIAVGARLLPEYVRYPKRFAEVVPGRLYRAGFPTPRHIRNLGKYKNVKTVVTLTNVGQDPKYKREQRAIAAASMTLVRVPMPGDGCAELGDLDRAADALATALARPNRSPVFFHCDAGKQRTNAVLAAYRMRIKGWSLEQALDELENRYDFDRRNEHELADHLAAYADWLFASGWRPTPHTR